MNCHVTSITFVQSYKFNSDTFCVMDSYPHIPLQIDFTAEICFSLTSWMTCQRLLAIPFLFFFSALIFLCNSFIAFLFPFDIVHCQVRNIFCKKTEHCTESSQTTFFNYTINCAKHLSHQYWWVDYTLFKCFSTSSILNYSLLKFMAQFHHAFSSTRSKFRLLDCVLLQKLWQIPPVIEILWMYTLGRSIKYSNLSLYLRFIQELNAICMSGITRKIRNARCAIENSLHVIRYISHSFTYYFFFLGQKSDVYTFDASAILKKTPCIEIGD